MAQKTGRAPLPFGLLLAVPLIGAAAWGTGGLPVPAHPPDVTTQLGNMGAVAVMIERSVEVYLGLTRQNGAERAALAEAPGRPPATPVAASAALLLGLFTAIAGLRILPSLDLGPDPALPPLVNSIRAAIDVTLSGALMGGGSMLVHEAAEAVKTGLRKAGS
jgi:hypothetical protein